MVAHVQMTGTVRTRSGEGRIVWLDAARMAAFSAVVFLHAPQVGRTDMILSQVARAAVPFFFILSGYLLTRTAGRPPAQTAGRQLVRIGVPYLFWTAVYVVVARVPLQTVFSLDFLVKLIEGKGPAFHLWFLGSLILCSLMLVGLRTYLSGRAMIAVGLVLYAAALMLGPYYSFLSGGGHLAWSATHGPLFGFVFMAIGHLLAEERLAPGWRLTIALAVGGFALHLAELFGLRSAGALDPERAVFFVGTLPYAVGLFLASRWIPEAPPTVALARIGRYGLGLYCAHLLALQLIVPHVVVGNVLQTLAVSAAAILATSVLCVAIGQVPLLRPLVR